jgi:energy-coupling factor transporter transmembrane protein EcfT
MVKFHPVILIVSFLVFVAMLAFPDGPALLISSLILLSLYLRDGGAHFRSALVMLRRMRWFLFSILFVFCWFTPGTPVVQWSALSGWLPTVEGLSSGLLRVSALILVIASVNLLLRSLSRDELLAAIYFLASPLTLVGVRAEKVAVRMMLVFDAMAEAQAITASYRPEKGQITRRLDSIGQLASNVFSAVVERAENAQQKSMVLPVLERPQVFQWSLPLLLWGVFYFSGLFWS